MDPTAAPVDLTINGTTYAAHPLRDIDHETMNKWVRQEYMRRVRDSLGEDPGLIQVALSQVATMQWRQGEGLRITTTVKGMHKLACLMTRKPIPFEDCKDAEAINVIMDTFSTLEDDPEDGEAPEGQGTSSSPK